MKKYNIIYADPPWTYRDKAKAGNRGASFKYPTMLTKHLKYLDVNRIAAENCALFLWVTSPLLPESFEIIREWGFTYKTVAFAWHKTYEKSGKDFVGMGHYTRANMEQVLLGIKGKMKRQDASVRQIVTSPILKPHSRKPNEIRSRIIQLFGDLPRVELFATEQVSGWDCIGYEANGQAIQDFIGSYQNMEDDIVC